MKLRTRATPWAESEAVGRLYLDIVRDSTWNVRRVETIRLLDQDLIERRVSLNIDVQNLRKRVKRAGFKGIPTFPLPIFTQVKTLMLDLDIRLGNGEALSLATSAQDSWIAYSMLLCVASEHGLDPASFSPNLLEAIYACVRHLPDSVELQAIEQIDSIDRVAEYWASRATDLFSSNVDRDAWGALFAIPQFAALASDFALKSMAIARIQLTSDRTALVKYRYVDVGLKPEPRASEAWGIDDFVYFVAADSIGFAQREHTRVLAPDGMEITGIRLWEKSEVGLGELVPIWVSASHFHRRTSGERGVIYTRRLPKGSYMVEVSLQPRVEELIAPALFSVGLTSILLGIFAALQLLHSYYFDQATADDGLLGKVDTDSLTTTLLLVPTLLSLFLVRPREHSLVGRLLLRVRVLVLVTAFCMVASASAVALGLQGVLLGVTFTLGFLVSTSILLVLVVAFLRARERSATIRKNDRRVSIENILVSPLLPD